MDKERITRVLDFWLKDVSKEQWFKKDDAFDEKIAKLFGDDVENAISGNLDDWADIREGLVALTILLDQFTRNIYRDMPKAFASDGKALELSLKGQGRGYLDTLGQNERYFMLMPMMHSEDLSVQNASLPLFEKYTTQEVLGYAVKHRDIIQRFGRFPHRNEILGRESTAEEIEFLKQPGSSF